MALENDCDKTIGSILELYLSDVKDVVRMPSLDSEGRIIEQLALYPTKTETKIVFREGSAGLIEKPKQTKHGDIFEYSLKFAGNKNDYLKKKFVRTNLKKRFIARAKDGNGNYILLGTIQFPAKISIESTTGFELNEKNEVTYELKVQMLDTAPYYKLDTELGLGIFSTAFSTAFA